MFITATDVRRLFLAAQPEGEDDLKKRQLMELAILNGTYRDTKSGSSSSTCVTPQPALNPSVLPRKCARTHLLATEYRSSVTSVWRRWVKFGCVVPTKLSLLLNGGWALLLLKHLAFEISEVGLCLGKVTSLLIACARTFANFVKLANRNYYTYLKQHGVLNPLPNTTNSPIKWLWIK